MPRRVEVPEELTRLIAACELELDVDVHAARAAEGGVERLVVVSGGKEDAAFLCADAVDNSILNKVFELAAFERGIAVVYEVHSRS